MIAPHEGEHHASDRNHFSTEQPSSCYRWKNKVLSRTTATIDAWALPVNSCSRFTQGKLRKMWMDQKRRWQCKDLWVWNCFAVSTFNHFTASVNSLVKNLTGSLRIFRDLQGSLQILKDLMKILKEEDLSRILTGSLKDLKISCFLKFF